MDNYPSFAFQENKWLGDVRPEILSIDQRVGLVRAKVAAKQREQAEAEIHKHLLYTAGWPTCIPTFEEALMLCRVRRSVGIEGVKFTEPQELIARYQQLMDEKDS